VIDVVESLFSFRNYIGNGFIVVSDDSISYAVDITTFLRVVDEYVYIRRVGVVGAEPLYSVVKVMKLDSRYKIVLRPVKHIDDKRLIQLYKAVVDYINKALGEKTNIKIYVFEPYPKYITIDIGSNKYVYIPGNRPRTIYKGKKTTIAGYFTRMCIDKACDQLIDELYEVGNIMMEYNETIYALPKEVLKRIWNRFSESIKLDKAVDPYKYIKTILYGIYVEEFDRKRLIMGNKTISQARKAIRKAKELALKALEIAKEEAVTHKLLT